MENKLDTIVALIEGLSVDEKKSITPLLFEGMKSADLFRLSKQTQIDARMERAEESRLKRESEGKEPRKKLSLEFGHTAYRWQMNEACDPKESLTHAADIHGEDVQEVLEVKNDRWPYNDVVVKLMPERFAHEDKIINTIRKNSASDIEESTTLNAGLNALSRMQRLEKDIREIQEENYTLKGVAIDHELRMEAIEDAISMKEMTPQQKAIRLESKGVKRVDIAKYLGVDRKTVGRWLGKKKE